jgi:hypothetical protein
MNDPATCQNLKSRDYLSGPLVFYALVQNNGPNGQADVQVNTPNPCNCFFIVSRKGGTEANSIFFHLTKLNKSYTTVNVATTASGFEQWISMNTLPASGTNYLTVIKFKEKINTFFLDIGFEGGAGPITIACVADDELSVNGGLYT